MSATLWHRGAKSAPGVEIHTGLDLSVDIVEKSILLIVLLFLTFITFLLERCLGFIPVLKLCVTFILQVTTLYAQGNAPQNATIIIGLKFPRWQAAKFKTTFLINLFMHFFSM